MVNKFQILGIVWFDWRKTAAFDRAKHVTDQRVGRAEDREG